MKTDVNLASVPYPLDCF